MKKLFLIALVLCALLFVSNAQEQTYRFKQITKEEGLSNNRVYSLIQDRNGFLWIGTLDGLNRYDGYEFKVFKNEPDNLKSISNNRAMKLFEDSKGNIWIAGKNTGVNKFDPTQGIFSRFSESEEGSHKLQNDVYSIFEQKGNLYIHAEGGILRYNYETDLFDANISQSIAPDETDLQEFRQILRNYFSQDVIIISSYADRESNIWLGLKDIGLVRVNADKSITYFKDFTDKKNDINAILEDNSGIIWVGTHNEGLFKYNPSSENFALFQQFKNDSISLDKIQIRALTKDTRNNIWIGTSSKGIVRFNRTSKEFHYYMPIENDETSLPYNKIRSLFTDSRGSVWVGSYRGLSRYNTESDNFKNYLFEGNNSDYRVYNITEDRDGNLWIANWENLVRFNPNDETSKIYSKNIFGLDNIRSVCFDHNNKLWITAEFGGISCFNIQEETVDDSYNYIKEQLPDQNVFGVYEDMNYNLWISTFNGLCFVNPQTREINQYSTLDGMPGNMAYGTKEDLKGNIWIATSNGLAMLDRQTNTFKIYTEEYGLQSNEFLEGGFFETKDKSEIIVGGTNGFNVFNPANIFVDTSKPQLNITGLLVLNKPVQPNQEVNKKIILRKSIEYAQDLKFNRLDRIISFEFTGLHFKDPGSNQYAYKLEGFDEDWIPTKSDRRFATYTNLNPGDYIFKVKASNCDGEWNEEGQSISFHVKPPFWRTFWFYLLVIGLIVYIVYLYIQQREKQAQEMNRILEQKVKDGEKVIAQKIQEVNEQKAEIVRKELEEQEMKYFDKGMAYLGGVLSEHNSDIDDLSRSVTNAIADYLEVEMANVYVIEKVDGQGDMLIKRGIQIHSDDDSFSGYHLGEGIPGTCYNDKEIITVDNLPKGERVLESGLVEAPLTHLVAMPIALTDLKVGVLELASLKKVTQIQIKLLNKFTESLCSAIEIIRSNKEMSKLLEESKQNEENLAAQEEELRQNLEEVSAIQDNAAIEKERLTRKFDEAEARYNDLHSRFEILTEMQEAYQQIIQQVNFPLFVKDANNKIITCNKLFAQVLGYKTILDVPDHIDVEMEIKLNELKKEKVIKLTNNTGVVSGELITLNTGVY